MFLKHLPAAWLCSAGRCWRHTGSMMSASVGPCMLAATTTCQVRHAWALVPQWQDCYEDNQPLLAILFLGMSPKTLALYYRDACTSTSLPLLCSQWLGNGISPQVCLLEEWVRESVDAAEFYSATRRSEIMKFEDKQNKLEKLYGVR